MLSVGRFDYLIEFSFITMYNIKLGNINIKPYSIPFRELKGKLIYGSVGCSKTKVGHQIIEKINSVIKEKMAILFTYSEKWLDKNTINAIKNQGIYKKMLYQ